MRNIKKEYSTWLEGAVGDGDLIPELLSMNDAGIEDAFYRDLAFGTGGLRGTIGAGTNRMTKFKVYISISSDSMETAKAEEQKIADQMTEYMQ